MPTNLNNTQSNTSLSFPRTDIPKSEKKNEYHKQFVLAIVNETIGNTFDINQEAMHSSIEFFDGTQPNDAWRFIQESADGEVLPAKFLNFNRVRVRVNTLIGEMSSRGYMINATSINKDAKARKLQARQQAKVDTSLAPARQELEAEFGLDLAPQGKVFETEEEVDDHFKYNFKEKNEIIMESALRWLAQKHNWTYNRMAAYRDLQIMGRCFYENEIKDGLPYVKRLDPRYVIFDTNATDDFLSDSTFFGKIKYMPLADAAAFYNLKESEIREVYGRYQQYQKSGRVNGESSHAVFSGLANSNIDFFKGNENDNTLRVMVLTAYWLDQEVLTHRESEDSQGGEHIKEVGDNATKGKLRRNTIAQWRKATLIAGDMLKDWGILENSVRDNEALAETSCPIKGVIPHFLNGRGISVVDQMKGLQQLKDVTLYNLQLEMTTAGRKGFIYDVSQTPKGWDIHTVLKYLKTAGVAFIDSKKDGLPSTHNQFNPIDQTLSQSVTHYISISQMIDSEMDAITGVNYARQGQSTGANQGLGVTQTALMQSSMSTRTTDDLFMKLNEMVLNYQAGLVKLSFAGNERFAPIIGDWGVEFLEDTLDLELDDFGVSMEEVPPLLNDLSSFRDLVKGAIASGQISFPDAARLLIEKDIEVGITRLERLIEKREEDAMKQQQMAMEQQQAMTQQAQAQAEQATQQVKQFEQQGKESLANIQGGYKIQDRNLDGRQNIDEIVTGAKVEANQSQLSHTQDTVIEKLKSNAVARKEAENVSKKK